MYYPKSQTQTELYTNGDDFTLNFSGKSYSGAYFITGDNQAFTGKNPNDKPNFPLSPTFNRFSNSPTPLIISNPKPIINPGRYIIDSQYNNSLSNPINPLAIPPAAPVQIQPKPSKSDYQVGEIERYFVKKTNSIKYTEINKSDFTKFLNKESNVNWMMYNPFSLPWEITGDRSKVYNVNKKTITRVSNNLKLVGFNSYFKGRYDQFYKEDKDI